MTGRKHSRSFMWILAVGMLLSGVSRPAVAADETAATSNDQPQRVQSGLLAIYDFRMEAGDIVSDRSGAVPPTDLKIASVDAVRRSDGALEIVGETIIRSAAPPRRLIEAIRRTGELTIEAWIRPADASQKGPARIVTLSKNGSERDFTLGQDGNRYDIRLRTRETSTNGIPSVSSPPQSLTAEVTHVVYTRSLSGEARIFLNGELAEQGHVFGRTSNWNDSYLLALANEHSNDRPWKGTYYLVAVYSRDLLTEEVVQNFRAGPDATAVPVQPLARDERAHVFETQVAPLLAKHCLECHDAANRSGGLNLSRQKSALAGGDNGRVIVPGMAASSPLWAAVESESMPLERAPLSSEEKQILRQWIDDGASWTLDTIDPAVYAHDGPAGENWLRRLTIPEYIESVRSTVGVDISKEARELLPPDLRADGFSNTAYNLNVDLKHVDAYGQLAQVIVERMDINAFALKFSSSRRFTDDDMGDLISRMGRWLLRGPLDDREVIAFRGISTTTASTGGDFEEAVGLIVEAMLQSPRFLYRMETQAGDGERWPVSEFELASRLSYTIWGGPPDQELLRAADMGELDGENIRRQIDRMLDDPRAVTRSLQFASEWLNLTRLNNLQPNRDRFPDWNAALADDMRRETLAFFEDVVWTQNRPLSDLLNAQVTFLTPRLAKFYNIPNADSLREGGESAADDVVARYDVSSVPGRGGLLTHGSILTVGGDDASMVARGLFVMHDLLRGVVRDPPPCVDTTPVPTKAGLTQRGISEGRLANGSCRGCHVKFEPLAFGLENFDGLGAFHEQDEHGNVLRSDGEILFPGAEAPVAYSTAADLADLLAASDRVKETITWKLTQFALGRPLTSADARTVNEIHRQALANGGTYRNLLTEILMSDLVQMTATEVMRPAEQ
ncbi:MAG: DUF1592 domain-containing protein [Planctomycetaceae bacterium]